MTIENGSLVTIAYAFKSVEGVLLGTSGYGGPFTFVIGSGDAMAGFEKNLLGAESGATLSFVIPAKEAYGELDETLVRVLPRRKIDSYNKLEEGQRVSDPTGRLLPTGHNFWVRAIDAQTVTLDANHPMAGMDLDFSVDVLYVGDNREAEAFSSKSSSCCGGSCRPTKGSSCRGSCAS